MQHIVNLLIICSLLFIPAVSSNLLISKVILDEIATKYGETAKQRTLLLQNTLIYAERADTDQEKLSLINNYYNEHLIFQDDTEHWGKSDYWATPLEFVASGAGDCEDYAIAKYFSLIAAGIAESKLRLTYVKAIKLRQSHMVLTYFKHPQSIPLVLDNLIPEIKRADFRNDLVPVYSFNGSGLWLAKTRGTGQRVGSSGRLSLWQNLKDKMQNGKL